MKAYLAWPVKWKNELVSMPEGHITLKYIGELGDLNALVLANRISAMLKDHNTELTTTGIQWFAEQFNPSTHVMVIRDLPYTAFQANTAVDQLRPDDYKCWNPHVTLNKVTCHMLEQFDRTPQQVIESIGPLTLYVDKKPYRTY